MTGGPQLMTHFMPKRWSTPAQKAPVEVRQAAMPSRSTISLYFNDFNDQMPRNNFIVVVWQVYAD